jgi:hypothetical protein
VMAPKIFSDCASGSPSPHTISLAMCNISIAYESIRMRQKMQ